MNTATAERRTKAATRSQAPGWLEILAGGGAYLGCMVLVYALLPLVQDDAVAGIVGFLVSGIMGIIALAVAALVRIRGLAAFGIRRAKVRHLLAGAGLGLIAVVLGIIASSAYTMLSGDTQNVQTDYQAGAAAGLLGLVLTFTAGSIITPIGEEAFFRGVVANALLNRFPAWIAIIASAAIFAVAHGINTVLPVAFVVGILTALLYRRTGSIWPGVVLHGVNNATATIVIPHILTATTT
ncbi:type II CAAX endopeptidase family protein [Cryobacterium sp. PH31-O1]|uniref:type II CAAX endopeptidase family protein n=1 Tax=Cryobacterium sp. PH31-O1 TaxID=3046306 RepID=UPI0024BA5555|nr:type II CAAX endopeptidase family protein [Cryobacterium sp. PH31-O1]MDJ0336657.1 type II CAAX endopeptidase family protein [Cryobacterium sp. PH31-O1]